MNHEKNINQQIEKQLRSRQTELLYDESVTVIPIMLAIAVLTLFIYWDNLSHNHLLLWFSALLLLSVARLSSAFRFRKVAPGISQQPPWMMLFLVGLFLSACLWAGLSFMVVTQLSLQDATFALLILVGLTAGSSTYLVICKRAYLTLLTPQLLPLALYLILTQQGNWHMIGWILLAMFAFLLIASVKPHQNLNRGLLLHFERNELLEQLEQEKQEIQRLNTRLNRELDEINHKEQELIEERDRAEELTRKMQNMSSQDGLTGVANRRRLDDFLRVEWARSQSEQTPLSMILCDIDQFQLFNETYGHQAADNCLQRIAQLLDNYSRRGRDLVARFEKDAFGLILPDTEHTHAVELAERLCQEVRDLKITHSVTGSVVSLSFGVASTTADEDSSAAILIANADKAMQVAKQKGRNQVASSCEAMS